ncbi:MAG: hypothetical protein KAJ75_00615 [Alphaproteobacteria bacterium]|nr:hypothetical protein [Alphaproteobacteria bacterium]
MAKHYNLNLISYQLCYTVDDISLLFKKNKLHVQTVRSWIKNGLNTIDSKQPLLVFGYELKEFLGKLNNSKKISTKFDEFYCFSCKCPEIPYQRKIYIEKNGSYIKAKGICTKSKKPTNKSYKLTDYQELKKTFNLVDELELYDSTNTPLKTHILDHDKNASNESLQGSLF